jgi:L,D-transpeptidase catalytic domain
MHGGTGSGRRRVALGVALLACALGAPASSSATDGVLWQGGTPEDQTAFAAAVGKELRIPFEATGALGSSVEISGSRLPAGARLERLSDAPARAIFRWRPSAAQLGDYTLFFGASAGSARAPRIKLYLHVGRRATRTFRLSNPSGLSQNATLLRAVNARAKPSASSRVVTRLSRVTPEDVQHVVYLVGGAIDRDGRYWLKVQLPILPNGSTGWIPRDAVEGFRSVDTHLFINRGSLRATLFRRGRPIFRSIVGVGLPHWPTPAGHFYIRERLTGFTDPIYGVIAFGTNGRSAVLTDWPGGGFIGVHGTNQPEILPGRVSHGCVRMPNSSISRLDRLMRVGTPVTIK